MNCAVTSRQDSSREHKKGFFALQNLTCESIALDYVDERLGLMYMEIAVYCSHGGLLHDAIETFTRERGIREKLEVNTLLSGRLIN